MHSHINSRERSCPRSRTPESTLPGTPGFWQCLDEGAGGRARQGRGKEWGLDLNLLPIPRSSLRVRRVTSQDLFKALASESVLRAQKKEQRAGTGHLGAAPDQVCLLVLPCRFWKGCPSLQSSRETWCPSKRLHSSGASSSSRSGRTGWPSLSRCGGFSGPPLARV